MTPQDPGALSLLGLFRMEADAQAQVLTSGLLALERDPAAADQLECCMRAAHSLKGAARIVGLGAGVRVAHAMEDCFVAAQKGRITLGHAGINSLLGATDLLVQIASVPEPDPEGSTTYGAEVDTCLTRLGRILEPSAPERAPEPLPAEPAVSATAVSTPGLATRRADDAERVLRVTAESLNRLLGLAGESLIESRWVKPFAESLLRLKRMHHQSSRTIDRLREILTSHALSEEVEGALADAVRTTLECEEFLTRRLAELELFDQRTVHLSHRMYDEALACRMRPFGDGVQAFPRMVRDVAQSLGKQVRLEIAGEATQVDRDVLAKLDAPLGHLLRNAIDHGVEPADERIAAGKCPEAVIRLEARHSAGALHVTVSDDGQGVDLEKTRAAVVARGLISSEAAAALNDTELLEFLFLPGFSMKGTVTDISGRGVGLDVVQNMVRQVRGTVRIASVHGQGTRFILQLPVTLSVVRTLLAEVGGEPYAIPLAAISRTLKVRADSVELLEGRQHFEFDGRRVGLVSAHQVLGHAEPSHADGEWPVIVLGAQTNMYGLVVDRFLGERELVVLPLDPHLGKIQDISAAALMENGAPVLIVDAEDLIRSMDRLVSDTRVNALSGGGSTRTEVRQKRVLVVDDSLTVRELERKLLSMRGYAVEVAVDGMDGWNAIRSGHFDLVVTDIDMPRMDGIELVTLINRDPRLKSVPVVVVSYKDREEDRQRGLEAGAAYYLTKSSFQDETLVQTVADLIGEAAA